MKKTVIVVLIASALYAAAVNMRARGTIGGGKRGFTRRIGGVYGYLHQTPTYYKPYIPKKWTCCRGKPCKKICYRKVRKKKSPYPKTSSTKQCSGRCLWRRYPKKSYKQYPTKHPDTLPK